MCEGLFRQVKSAWFLDVQFEYIDAGEMRLHYAALGDPANPMMLCLHGFPEYWAAWREIMPLLAKRFYVVAPDQRGFGLSGKPSGIPAYQTRHLVADIAALADGLSARRRFFLFGHDWGAAVAYAFAMHLPERLSGLVIANGVHPMVFQRAILNDPDQRAASQYMSKLRAPEAEAVMRADNFSRTLNMIAGFSATDWMSQQDRDAYRSVWRIEGAMDAMLNWYRASPVVVPRVGAPHDDMPGGIPILELSPEALRIHVPHLVIWGEMDTALRPVCLDGLREFVPDLTVRNINDAGHWILHERPAEVVDHVEQWIDGRGLM